jgi:hypothetical protein
MCVHFLTFKQIKGAEKAVFGCLKYPEIAFPWQKIKEAKKRHNSCKCVALRTMNDFCQGTTIRNIKILAIMHKRW